MVLLGVFLGMLLMPALLFAFRTHSGAASRPAIGFERVADAEYWSEWGSYLESRFPVSEFAIEANATLDRLLGDTFSEDVVFGSDGWLFHRQELERACFTVGAPAAEAAQHLFALREALNERGAELVVIIAPDKAEIVSSQLSPADRTKHECSSDRVNELRGAIESAIGSSYVEPLPLLRMEYPAAMYFRTDTHWTDEGAAVAIEEIFERIAAGYWNTLNVSPASASPYIGDLGTFIGAPRAEEASTLKANPAPTLQTIEDDRNGGPFGFYHTRQIGGVPPFESVLVLHDSFLHVRNTSGIQGILATLGRETRFQWWLEVDWEERGLAEMLGDADLVIIETVARFSIGRFPKIPLPR
jgi:hypothetical protein